MFGLPGSKVLVTTRKENVALVMHCSKDDILKVGTLSDEDCWLIVSKIAFFGRSEIECKCLEGIGKEISKKSKGLPLAAKTLGGILQFKKTRDEWQSILESEIWELEETQRDVFATLWLSYYDLSPTLKRCFSYCAIFPKDYQIEKKMLIELWMAQGYLKQGQRNDLETIGEEYFQILARRSFFQDFKKDNYDDWIIGSCKMHDIVYDFAQIVARNECHYVHTDDSRELIRKVRHLYLYLPRHWSYCLRKKRSLLLWGARKSQLTRRELSSLFNELAHARSLSLKNGDFVEIPSSISKLVHLKYLDLSFNNKLKQLPEKLCELHSLQTINVSFCGKLELPLGIGHLINLRHLRNLYGPTRLPKGIGRLTGLRTLDIVDVGCDGDAFSLGDLKNLNQLRGRLTIRNLGAHNHHVGQAKQAELKKKERLSHLELHFSFEGKEIEEEMLEALEPSPNLEILLIYCYRGRTFPGWMISLTNLRRVTLYSCENLPSLGKLPSLETLVMWAMRGVKNVGVELLGIDTPIGESKSETSASSSSSSFSPVIAFPKLTTLKFIGMPYWDEWDDYNDGTTRPPAIIMPYLRSLEIRGCGELKALPDYILQNTMLRTLEISQSNLLEERYNKEKGEDWSKISHISNVKILE